MFISWPLNTSSCIFLQLVVLSRFWVKVDLLLSFRCQPSIEWHPHKTPDTSCASVCVHPECSEVGWSRTGRNMRAAFYDYFMMCSGGSMAQCSRYGDQDRLRVFCHTRQINFWMPCHPLYPGFYPHTLSAVICSWIIFGDYLCGLRFLHFSHCGGFLRGKKKDSKNAACWNMPPQARASFRGSLILTKLRAERGVWVPGWFS
jgi:hypothetical protein